MTYRVTLSGKKEDARKAFEEQADGLIKGQNMSEEGKSSGLKLLDALPDGVVNGTIADHNNGNVDINVRVTNDPYAVVRAAAEVQGTDHSKGMPGAAAAGRPELTPSGGKAAGGQQTSSAPQQQQQTTQK
jgi:hypothetical protein